MKTETRSISTDEIKKDEYVFDALDGIPGYKPANEDYSYSAVSKLFLEMKSAQKTEVLKEGEFKAARDNRISAEHAFHDAILQVKTQIRAQFGEDSNELQSIGLKKKSERKPPKRKPATEK
ncbi:MAG: hypothetical protein LBV41_04550 [Cytophagaceae bacterium]|jgi:hypothetical protein|nr:hypothetical protein [Cytophagaceae bacterium]